MASYVKRQTKHHGIVWDVMFRYRDASGHEVQKKLSGYPTKKEAVRAFNRFTPPTSDVPPGKSPTGFSVALEAYIEARRGVLAHSTLYDLERKLKAHVLPWFRGRQVSSVSKADVLEWQAKIWNERNPRTGELFSQATCEGLHVAFRSFMSWASGRFSFPDPFEGVRIPHRREPKREMRVWTPEQFSLFLAEVKSESLRVIFLVLFYSGCRESEANALTAEDFLRGEDGAYSVRITKSASYKKGEGVILTPPKNCQSNRTVPLPAALTPTLDLFLAGKSGALWMFSAMWLRTVFAKGTEAAGLPRIRIHDLRHSHASMLISAGVPISLVSQRLGHSSVKTTLDVYAHYFAKDESELLRLLDGFVTKMLPN